MSLRKIASLDDLWSGEMMGLEVDGTTVLLVNVDDRIYAYWDACPHQKSRLSEGSLTGKMLRCARHHWEFDEGVTQKIDKYYRDYLSSMGLQASISGTLQ